MSFLAFVAPFATRLAVFAVRRIPGMPSPVPAPEPAQFHHGLNARGMLLIPEQQGPEYPFCLIELERLYRAYHDRVTKKVLCKAGRLMDEFRVVTPYEHPLCIARFAAEFCVNGTTVIFVFQEVEYFPMRPIRLVVHGPMISQRELSRVCRTFEFNLLQRLAPREAHAADCPIYSDDGYAHA